jgi:hypothetical protein
MFFPYYYFSTFILSLSDISNEMTWYLKANWVIFNVANSAAIVVTLAFWGLVYTGETVGIS